LHEIYRIDPDRGRGVGSVCAQIRGFAVRFLAERLWAFRYMPIVRAKCIRCCYAGKEAGRRGA